MARRVRGVEATNYYFSPYDETDRYGDLGFCLEHGMEGAFFAGGNMTLLGKFVRSMPEVAEAGGASWNYFDSVGGIYKGAYELATVSERKSRQHTKVALATQDIVAGTLLAIVQTIDLIPASALGGIVMFSPLAPFGFALCMLGGLTRSVYQLQKAQKKTNLDYLLNDRLRKYNNLRELFNEHKSYYEALLSQPRSPESIKEIAKARQKLNDLKREMGRQVKQAESLALYLGVNANDSTKLKLEKIYERNGCSGLYNESLRGYLDGDSDYDLPDDYKEVATNLKAKQIEKRNKHIYSTVAWGLSAVGATLIAFAIFFPPLLIPGIVILAAAGAMKLGLFSPAAKTGAEKVGAILKDAVRTRDVYISGEENINDDGLKNLNYGVESKLLLSGLTRQDILMAYLCARRNKNEQEDPRLFSVFKNDMLQLKNKSQRKYVNYIVRLKQQYIEDYRIKETLNIPHERAVTDIYSAKDRKALLKQTQQSKRSN